MIVLIWWILPLIFGGLLIVTSRPLAPRAKVGIVAFWCALIAVATPATLGPFRNDPWFGWFLLGVAIAAGESILWAIVLIKPPAARPPVAPGKPSNYVPSSQTRTYRSQRRWL